MLKKTVGITADEQATALSPLKSMAALIRAGDVEGALSLAEGSEAVERQEAPAKINLDNPMLSIELRQVLKTHAAARRDLNDKCILVDAKELGREPTRKDKAIWDKADHVEREALMALCSLPVVTDSDRVAKAAYLLDFGCCSELQPEHMEALLESMVNAPASGASWRSAYYDLESEIHDAVNMTMVLSDLLADLFGSVTVDSNFIYRVEEWDGTKALFLGGQAVDKAKAILTVWKAGFAKNGCE
ncbi:hypothetical protein [Mesorhizobium sp. L-8-3]|uniref:hypothetical protein n=1 Tax=Mesorhizobium sp. L-8-3 TaxID=2744522 RepID=UPI00193869B2|nr:hypothetical protein [Mesorhizobium sp. L-8-3]BCH22102.1 hypothetical protein MesoLjLb_18870 [Mesorhizobium sp. L-8-3]